MDSVKITERGWAGHFICSGQCRFRRNTLIEYGGLGDTYFRCSICSDEWDLDAGTPVENGMKYCPNAQEEKCIISAHLE